MSCLKGAEQQIKCAFRANPTQPIHFPAR